MHRTYKILAIILIVILSTLACNKPKERINIKPWKSLKLYEPAQKEYKGLLSVDFKDTPLSTALQIISEHSGKSILIDEDIAKIKITFRKIDSSPESIIDALCSNNNLNKNEVSKSMIILSKEIERLEPQ